MSLRASSRSSRFPSSSSFVLDYLPSAASSYKTGDPKNARLTWYSNKGHGACGAVPFAVLSSVSAVNLEQSRAALAAADAHRHDAPFGLAALAFLEDVAGETRAGHAEGMADRDRAAVDVVLVGIDAELVARIEALAGEGFVELPEIDVVDLQAMTLQQLRHGKDRADAHLVRLATRRRPSDEAAHRIEAALLRVLGFHQHNGCGAVRQLAGVAGRDVFARALHRLELGETFERGLGTVALVAVDDVVDDRLGLGRLVDHLHLRLHRDDLVLEIVGLLGGGHAALRLQRIFVLVFAAD